MSVCNCFRIYEMIHSPEWLKMWQCQLRNNDMPKVCVFRLMLLNVSVDSQPLQSGCWWLLDQFSTVRAPPPPWVQFLFCQSVRYSVCFKCWLSTIFLLSEISLDRTAELAVPDYWTSRQLVPHGITILLIEPDVIIAVWLSHCIQMVSASWYNDTFDWTWRDHCCVAVTLHPDG